MSPQSAKTTKWKETNMEPTLKEEIGWSQEGERQFSAHNVPTIQPTISSAGPLALEETRQVSFLFSRSS